MKFHREISSVNPDKCKMVAKNCFGIKVGETIHFHNGVRDWYKVVVRNETRGEATDFYHACNMLMEDLGVVHTKCV